MLDTQKLQELNNAILKLGQVHIKCESNVALLNYLSDNGIIVSLNQQDAGTALRYHPQARQLSRGWVICTDKSIPMTLVGVSEKRNYKLAKLKAERKASTLKSMLERLDTLERDLAWAQDKIEKLEGEIFELTGTIAD